MGLKLLNRRHSKTNGIYNVISARQAADMLGLSHNTFFKALDSGIIKPQAKIDGNPRPAYGFEVEYIKLILKIIPKNRIGGQTIFTSDLKEAMEKINIGWDKAK